METVEGCALVEFRTRFVATVEEYFGIEPADLRRPRVVEQPIEIPSVSLREPRREHIGARRQERLRRGRPRQRAVERQRIFLLARRMVEVVSESVIVDVTVILGSQDSDLQLP